MRRAIVSVCPPHAAEEVATAVARLGFAGAYLDANAISPTRARRINEIVTEFGATLVDGGIVGGPAWRTGTTRLYLSGDRAAEVAGWFEGSPLGTVVLANPGRKRTGPTAALNGRLEGGLQPGTQLGGGDAHRALVVDVQPQPPSLLPWREGLG